MCILMIVHAEANNNNKNTNITTERGNDGSAIAKERGSERDRIEVNDLLISLLELRL